MAARWEQVRQEWRQNRRFRLGLLVVLLVLGLQGVLMLSDRQKVLAEGYEREAALLDRLTEASRESAWPERADQAEAALAAARDTVPQVSSAGLAQAELQAWLSGQAASGGLQDPRVRVESTLDVPGQAELWQVIARLDAVVPPGRLEGFLRALSTGLPWIQAERLEVTEGRDTRLGVIVRAYYRKPAAPGAAGAAPAPNAPAADGAIQ
ncbi:MAG: hypothetical protein K0M70_12730 [Arenimonas sp.]|uniref:hypothetical protein n=1 Tax=Arenimonas sp. TaxID=1872635 RepID=UPI0025BBF965|nr:hypothetical protein [Arenimonas sp.]MBW8368709.1 hypothetical protein [Arenimonas sp.]